MKNVPIKDRSVGPRGRSAAPKEGKRPKDASFESGKTREGKGRKGRACSVGRKNV